MKRSKKPGKRTWGSNASKKEKRANDKEYRERYGAKDSKQDEIADAPEDTAVKRTRNPFNDASWYTKNPDLTAAAASIPFPYRPGMNLKTIDCYNITSKSHQIRKSAIPGIIGLGWMPSLGFSDGPNSPISVAARQIYAKVRSSFSGSIEADAPDFVIYLGALDSIFSYVACLKRLYRLVNSYSPNNYFIPEGIFSAFGIGETDYLSLVKDKMQLFSNINQLIGMLDRFICPAVFTMFNRHYWLNDNVYMDSASMNAQFYAFIQEGFYSFKMMPVPDDPSVTAGGLECKLFPSAPIGSESYVDTLFNFGVGLIDALSESDDAYIISGYLMRAFEGSDQFKVDRLGIDEKFDALYIPEVLQQIENAVCVGYASDKVINEVSQDPASNSVLCSPKVTVTVSANSGWVYAPQPMLSMRQENPTAIDVTEASRLSTYLDVSDIPYTSGDTEVNVPVLAGTEIVTSMVLTTIDTTNQIVSANVNSWVSSTNASSLAYWSNFDWAPRVCVLLSATVTPTFWDVHNVTAFSMEQMVEINKMCLYSEFGSFTQY